MALDWLCRDCLTHGSSAAVPARCPACGSPRLRSHDELFGLSIVAIAVSAGYDLAAGASRMYANTGALVATLVIWVLAVLQFWYAAAMRKKGLLR